MSTQPDAAEDALVLALTEVIKGATSPEIQSAQALLLRRLATQGDVIPSRIPAPLNITEVGGYLNFLETLGETQMRRDMLGSTLGLATGGLEPSAGSAVPPLRLTAVANHRPAGAAGAEVPLSVGVREDLAPALVAALVDLRAAAGMLPLWSPPSALPAPTGGTGAPPNPLLYLGRQVWVAPTAATVDPENDPVVLGRAASDAAPGYRLGIRVADGTPGAATEQWTGLAWDPVGRGFVERDLGAVPMLPMETALAGAVFVARRVPVAPTGRGDYEWARLTAVAGLLPGASRLGDELALVWSGEDIRSSAYASQLDATWDGTRFTL
jgi:hypothetical protein